MYGVITSDDNHLSNDIKRLLKKYKEGEDYHTRNNAGMVINSRIYDRTKYYLHPRTFKKCLMRSKNADYYLLLEESVKYYCDYQMMYKDKLLNTKDVNIKRLESMILEIRSNSKESNETIKRCRGLLVNQRDNITTLIKQSR